MASTNQDFGLLATSRYVPRLRLERSEVFVQNKWMAPGLKSLAKGRRAMANWDEDAITMAVEAARLVIASSASATPTHLTLASTTLPFADRLNAGVVAEALGLSGDIVARDVTSSMRAGTIELRDAFERGERDLRLLVASELKRTRPASAQELIVGHGAAAALIGTGKPIATFECAASVQADFVDHFRETGQDYDYAWEERWVREQGYLTIAVDAISACLKKAGVQASDIARFAMPAPLAKVNEAVAKRAGISAEAVVATAADGVGDIGCAQPISMLDTAVRSAAPGALILVASFGSGCDAILLKRTGEPCRGVEPDQGVPEPSYMKFLAFGGAVLPEWGMRAEMDTKTALSAAWRDLARAAHFEGGRCKHCGTVQFPAGRLCVKAGCRAQDEMEALSLADIPARVMSHTSDFLAYTPHPPFQFGHVDFEGGGRVMMEFADTAAGELAVGLPLRMVYRIKEFDPKRGFRRYFWKATPVRPIA